MGLLELFKKKVETAEGPTAVDYVEWLIKHMLRISALELTLDTGRPLPGSDLGPDDNPPPCLPDPKLVVNRLKVLSKVTPAAHPQPVGGAFERLRTHYAIDVRTRFTDKPERSICELRLHIRCQKA